MIDLFLRSLSRVVGIVSTVYVPTVLRGPIYGGFARFSGADLSQSPIPTSDFRSLQELFTRPIRSELRPIGDGIVSPVDGVIRSQGELKEGMYEQIKGRWYSLDSLLGGEDLSRRFIGGWYWNIYLAPADYHRVHVPFSGRVREVRYLPGGLYPVGERTLQLRADLFGRNERVASVVESDLGCGAVVMVGALNVGSMSLAFHPLLTNSEFFPGRRSILLDEPLTRGDEFGRFNLGSTVVVCIDASTRQNFGLSLKSVGDRVKIRESLMACQEISE